jgi:hypothetical protein
MYIYSQYIFIVYQSTILISIHRPHKKTAMRGQLHGEGQDAIVVSQTARSQSRLDTRAVTSRYFLWFFFIFTEEEEVEVRRRRRIST